MTVLPDGWNDQGHGWLVLGGSCESCGQPSLEKTVTMLSFTGDPVFIAYSDEPLAEVVAKMKKYGVVVTRDTDRQLHTLLKAYYTPRTYRIGPGGRLLWYQGSPGYATVQAFIEERFDK